MIASSARRLLLLVVALGALTHLPGLHSPAQVVFDEVHWGKAVNAYCCTGERIFDVHPPHGKLLLTAGAVLAGYRGGISFENIGNPYTGTSAATFRWVPALAGILIPALAFLLVLRLGGAQPTAFLAGALLALDNGLLLETHVMLFDGILVASTLGALVAILSSDGVARPGGARALRLLSGALCGLAVGTKFTGLVAPALVAAWICWTSRAQIRQIAARLAEVAAMAMLVYVAGWMIHFSLLTQPGLADAFHPTTGQFVTDFQVVHSTMFEANYNMRTPHPDGSGPLSWPWMKVTPFFWSGGDRALYLVGNPVVWWGSALLLWGIAVTTGLMRVTRLRLDRLPGDHIRLWVVVAGFILAYLPFFGIERTVFLYHYLTALVFAVVVVLLWLERAGWIRQGGLREQRLSYAVVLTCAAAAFVAVSPVTYGFSIGGYDEWLVGVLRSWR